VLSIQECKSILHEHNYNLDDEDAVTSLRDFLMMLALIPNNNTTKDNKQ